MKKWLKKWIIILADVFIVGMELLLDVILAVAITVAWRLINRSSKRIAKSTENRERVEKYIETNDTIGT